MKRTKRCLAGVVLLALASTATHAATSDKGRLEGTLRLDAKSVDVEGAFDARRIELHFGAPYACKVSADRFAGIDGERRYRFGISPNGGRFCDRLRGSEMTLTGQEPDLVLRVVSPDGVWSGRVFLPDH